MGAKNLDEPNLDLLFFNFKPQASIIAYKNN